MNVYGIIRPVSCLLLVGGLSLWGQSPAPQHHVKYSSFWTATAGYESAIFLYNTSSRENIRVSPCLYTASGTPVLLETVDLPPNSSKAIAVNDVLTRKGLLPQSGAAAFEYESPYRDLLQVETQVAGLWNQVGYTIPSQEVVPQAPTIDTVALIPSSSSRLEVAMFNTTMGSITVTPVIWLGNSAIKVSPVVLPPNGSAVSVVPNTSDEQPTKWKEWQDNTAIGISLECDKSCPIVASAWMVDESKRLSSMISFPLPSARSTNLLFGTQVIPGTTLGEALQAPNLDSRLVLRNLSSERVDVAIALHSDGVQVAVPAIQLAPHEVRAIEPLLVAKSKTLSDWAATIQYSGAPGSVIGRSFSVDRSIGSVAYASLEQVPYARYNGVLWNVSDATSTVLSITNFSEHDDLITIELFSQTEKVSLPGFSLPSHQTHTVDLKRVVPQSSWPSLGGFRVSATSAESRIVVKEQLILGHGRIVTPLYGGPPYVVGFHPDPNNFSVVEGGTAGFNCYLDYSDSSSYLNACGTPSSSNASAVYAITSGTSGTVYGVQPGTATITLNSGYTDEFGDRQPLQAFMSAVNCGFTIIPDQFNSTYCNTSPPPLQQKLFSATIQPSGPQCILIPSQSSCSAGMSTGDITLDVDNNGNAFSCNITSSNINGTVRFFGPTSPGASGASVEVAFNLRINGSNLPKSKRIPIYCP